MRKVMMQSIDISMALGIMGFQPGIKIIDTVNHKDALTARISFSTRIAGHKIIS